MALTIKTNNIVTKNQNTFKKNYVDIKNLESKQQLTTIIETTKNSTTACKTDEAVCDLARNVMRDLKKLLTNFEPLVCYVACSFGTSHRHGHVAWWYQTAETKDVETWLDSHVHNISDDAIFCRESKFDFEQINWEEHRLARNGGLSDSQVFVMAPLEDIKNAFLDDEWNSLFIYGRLAKMFEMSDDDDDDGMSDNDDSENMFVVKS